MALTSEDVVVNDSDSWVAIVLTGTVLHISEVRHNPIMFRFNIASLSSGTALDVGDRLTANETVYVKTTSSGLNATIVVSKD